MMIFISNILGLAAVFIIWVQTVYLISGEGITSSADALVIAFGIIFVAKAIRGISEGLNSNKR